MNEQQLAEAIVAHMLRKDAFSRWLELRVVRLRPGAVTLKMRVRPEMLNGFRRGHGGVTFSLADSALAFAANSRGRVAVSTASSMAYPKEVSAGDLLTATALEESLGNRVAFYRVEVTREDRRPVGLFRGTVYRTRRNWIELLAPEERNADQ